MSTSHLAPRLTRTRRAGLVTLVAVLAGAVPVALTSGQTLSQNTTPTPIEQLQPDLTLYRQHVTTLSNPFFEGRAPGTAGNRLAADYIETVLRRLSLQPAFASDQTAPDGTVSSVDRTSYRQVFTAPPSARPGESTRLTVAGFSYTAGSEVTLTSGKDFNILGHSANGEATGQLAFAGYAIERGEDDYNTFATKPDLTGKIVIVLRFEPMDGDGKSKWTDTRWTMRATLMPKLRSVQEAGAAGIILVNPPGAQDDRMGKLEGLELGAGRAMKVPVVMMSPEAADALVKAADGRSLMDLRKTADDLKAGESGVIDLANASITLKAKVERIPNISDNVGGILPGRGTLANEFIVIGSHYDHVGYGYFGSRGWPSKAPAGKEVITEKGPMPREKAAELYPGGEGVVHPGADDNASGTSGVLLAARKLSEAYASMPADANLRSILFLWFSAEESGLVGSRWYVNHPIVPLDKHYIMLNMDMIGRLTDNKLEFSGYGTSPGLKDWIQPYVDASGLTIAMKPGGGGPSDHATFNGKKVPVLFAFTGLHDDYHRPTDTYDTINMDGAVRIVDFISRIALDTAQRPEALPYGEWNPQPQEQAAAPDNPGPTATGVRFGIAPGDYTGSEPGVLVGEVFPDLPAAKAGIRAGDLIDRKSVV